MDIDLKNIKRRERRFYRTYKDGEIVYTDKSNNVSELLENKTINSEKNNIKIDNPTNKTNLENKEITETEKKRILDKILKEMDTLINPNIDEISDVIYSQLSSNNIEIKQETVKHIVEENIENRRSKRSAENKSSEPLDFLNDRKEMELVIDNIVEENVKEQTRNKAEEKKSDEKLKKETDSKPKKKEPEKPKEKIKKEEPKPKKKEEFKLDFGEDESDIEETDNDEDLGLKF